MCWSAVKPRSIGYFGKIDNVYITEREEIWNTAPPLHFSSFTINAKTSWSFKIIFSFRGCMSLKSFWMYWDQVISPSTAINSIWRDATPYSKWKCIPGLASTEQGSGTEALVQTSGMGAFVTPRNADSPRWDHRFVKHSGFFWLGLHIFYFQLRKFTVGLIRCLHEVWPLLKQVIYHPQRFSHSLAHEDADG